MPFFAASEGIKSGDQGAAEARIDEIPGIRAQGSFRRDQGIPPSSRNLAFAPGDEIRSLASWVVSRAPACTELTVDGGSRVRIVSLRRRDRCEPDFLDQGRSGPNGARAGGAPRWRLLGTR
jgi:hypothetical protein